MRAPDAPQSVETVEIRVRGTVQGVGFRPTVWRLARESGLTGQVLNDSAGVLIQITGEPARIARFLHGLKTNPPPLSRIEQLDVKRLSQIVAFEDFVIAGSVAGETRTNVTADAATCPACREEVFNPAERRFRYPFTNCTHCGPRLSIVTRVPYDRCEHDDGALRDVARIARGNIAIRRTAASMPSLSPVPPAGRKCGSTAKRSHCPPSRQPSRR